MNMFDSKEFWIATMLMSAIAMGVSFDIGNIMSGLMALAAAASSLRVVLFKHLGE